MGRVFFENYKEQLRVHYGHSFIGHKMKSRQSNNHMITNSTQMIQFAGAVGYSMRAGAYVGNGDLNNAIADLSAAITDLPDVANLYKLRGAVYGEKGDFDKSITDLNKAIQIGSDSDSYSYYYRSLAYLGKGNFERAFADCDKSLKLKFISSSTQLDAYLLRGFLYGREGDYGKAIADFEAALRIRVENVGDGGTIEIESIFHNNARECLKYAQQAKYEKEEQQKRELERKEQERREQERKEQERKEQERKEEQKRKEQEASIELKKANLRILAGTGFTIDFIQDFFKRVIEFDAVCKKINSEMEEKISKSTTEYSEKEKILLKKYQDCCSNSVAAKSDLSNQYDKALQKLNEAGASDRRALYAKIVECKNNMGDTESMRSRLFANAQDVKNEREKAWNEYQNKCGSFTAERNNPQKKAQETVRELITLAVQHKKSQEMLRDGASKKIAAEIEKFKTGKFTPEEIQKNYAEIYGGDPLVGDYKCVKLDSHPKSVRMAALSYNLNLGGHAKVLLETHYPAIYRHGKLIIPYCITVSETNGVCFLQTVDNRNTVYKTMQSLILKLLLRMQPGLLKLTLYDGEGSGKNLIGLSHIDKRIKGENILTDPGELKRALEAAVSDMNTTIQKVLGSKYADKTLMDYNEIAGKQAKPYHIICITDFPNGLGKEHLELITKIVRSGKQAGVFVIMGADPQSAPKSSYERIDISPLLSEMSVVEVGSLDNNLQLRLNDYFPDTELLEEIQGYISAEIKKASKVEVNLDSRVGEDKLWQSDSRSGIETPIGQLNVTDLQNFTLSVEDGSANIPHHCLIGGATGSGKTVLLHNIICYTAWNYSPDEVQFILLDYKEGVEFKVYENLPHAKVLSIHSEREYGISVLEYLGAELTRRAELFKDANGAQNIARYKENTGQKMPRLLVIIDEFQVLLNGDMKTATFVSKALYDIGGRGRSFGIHLILSSQSLSGVDINQTLSHLGLRVALKLNTERDCEHFLGQGNHAPFKVLQKKGEAIYNAQSGLPEGNVRFQVAYLSDKDINKKIAALQTKSVEVYGTDKPFTPRFLYDGNVSASFVEREYTPDHRKCKVYVGEPVALEAEHTSYSLLRQNESNILIVGQDILAAMSILNYSIRQIIPQSSEECKVYICNKVNMDNDYYGKLDSLREEFTGKVNLLEDDPEIQRAIETVFEEIEKRKTETNKNRIIFVFADIYNLRALRKSGYSDSTLAQKLVTILKDGPGLGVHCIIHASSFDNLKNILDVHSILNEFNVRIELRGGDGYKIFQSNDMGIEKATPIHLNTANMQTLQMNGIRKIKVYSF